MALCRRVARSFRSLETTIICALCRASLPALPPIPLTRSIVTKMVCSENVSPVSRRNTSLIPSGSSSAIVPLAKSAPPPTFPDRGTYAFSVCRTQCATKDESSASVVRLSSDFNRPNGRTRSRCAAPGTKVTFLEGWYLFSTTPSAVVAFIEERSFSGSSVRILVPTGFDSFESFASLARSRSKRTRAAACTVLEGGAPGGGGGWRAPADALGADAATNELAAGDRVCSPESPRLEGAETAERQAAWCSGFASTLLEGWYLFIVEWSPEAEEFVDPEALTAFSSRRKYRPDPGNGRSVAGANDRVAVVDANWLFFVSEMSAKPPRGTEEGVVDVSSRENGRAGLRVRSDCVCPPSQDFRGPRAEIPASLSSSSRARTWSVRLGKRSNDDNACVRGSGGVSSLFSSSASASPSFGAPNKPDSSAAALCFRASSSRKTAAVSCEMIIPPRRSTATKPPLPSANLLRRYPCGSKCAASGRGSMPSASVASAFARTLARSLSHRRSFSIPLSVSSPACLVRLAAVLITSGKIVGNRWNAKTRFLTSST
mmetsp:Transcript_10501/g.34765  ORF Transcript_10501/g.34765 Transcript_10501/m.34765 type:complete len:544 (+) Transcript_10501:2712-4343(+)